jgi:hypothetical protein
MPSEVAEGVFVFEIAGLIAFNFGFPEIDAGFRKTECGTVLMPMPEAAVDEEGLIDD